jgi:hypothetical protein
MAKAKKEPTNKEIKILEYQKILKSMEKKLSQSFKKLSSNMLKNAPVNTIKKDSHDLLMLLGEVNYLTKECKKMK